MRLFDSHAHIASERFAGDLPEVLGRMRAAGVAACVVVCDPGDVYKRQCQPCHERFFHHLLIHPTSLWRLFVL